MPRVLPRPKWLKRGVARELTKGTFPWKEAPGEILNLIFENCSAVDLWRLSTCSTFFRDMICDKKDSLLLRALQMDGIPVHPHLKMATWIKVLAAMECTFCGKRIPLIYTLWGVRCCRRCETDHWDSRALFKWKYEASRVDQRVNGWDVTLDECMRKTVSQLQSTCPPAGGLLVNARRDFVQLQSQKLRNNDHNKSEQDRYVELVIHLRKLLLWHQDVWTWLNNDARKEVYGTFH
ncbi:hypothetical protein C8J56DRAFT_952625 [Mycena floridula]|nr:hypothetical protein C8J56DRAFT_952625 [Mycena floridula]